MRIYLNLGSNIGNRLANLKKAIAAFYNEADIRVGSIKESRVIESDAWGYASANAYLNIGMSFCMADDYDISAIWDMCRRIERSINGNTEHRDFAGNYRDRILDIDIIAIDERIINQTDLVIPHERMHMRDFVKIPMAELNPEWRHPIFGKKITEL